jgi:hypothetical protein
MGRNKASSDFLLGRTRQVVATVKMLIMRNAGSVSHSRQPRSIMQALLFFRQADSSTMP